ncbi:RNA binding S1 domain protein [Pseudopedobacter saltans DSM 12145]|uniref:RNA binding S1 domain protein n=1 Tax=Pseudopedobacter saltans (strain ATCC 51119 / DSM 12145 / JCM 21818 / CCUG 39354 / LMG 10337 / NBRC 100064 / NCIMB 13643) TaxID=762903 RepID=F0S7A1_PSESL|nr:S1 RNA-binding domain-containing protein [Pseudopedobacter saltans]ADY51126.1 RNA binding S1 domain protein [Pseudopedobacter saltans DSM 12145]
MLDSIINKYNPKDPSTHGILKYFSEQLSEKENISFILEIFKSGSWLLATEISRTNSSEELNEKTTIQFYGLFDQWVANRIDFSNTIFSSRTRNPYITTNLHFQFREALLSIKNLDFPEKGMKILEKLILNVNPIYLERFLDGTLWIVIEEYEEKEIEVFLSYFIKAYIANSSINIINFLYHSLNVLAFTHKIYYLSDIFIKSLNQVSKLIIENRTSSNYKQLILVLLIDLIQNKKLDLSSSKYEYVIKETLDSLDQGSISNLNFLLFLKRFNYSFDEYDAVLESEALLENISEKISSIPKRTDIEIQALLHHLIKTSNEYFELFLFHQELMNQQYAEEHILRFINLIDEIRIAFLPILWYEEFLNFSPINGEISFATEAGFEVKVDEEFFKRKILEKKIESKITDDFILHFGYGFLNTKYLTGYPKANLFLKRSKQTRKPLDLKDKDQIEEIERFYISNLNYSASNKKNVLILTPFKDTIHKIITKYELKAFFHSLELFLIEKANNYLSILSPFPKKSHSFKIIVPPKYISEYNLNLSEGKFWEILKRLRPYLYKIIYLNHKEKVESIKKINYAFKNDRYISGVIKSTSKGGLIVDIFGVEAFLPGSQIDVKPVIDYDSYIGKTLDFKIVKISEANQNTVVSRRLIIESVIEMQREEISKKLEKGQILEGTIKNITYFGAFIDLGGIDGLLYITDISWGRINHPSDLLELNQKIHVVVLDYEDNKKRISLGLKQLHPNPWDALDAKIKIGTRVTGKVVSVEDYGIFLEIEPGVEGLVHISDISWSSTTVNCKELFKLGDFLEAIVITVGIEERKMSLGLKQLISDSWINKIKKYTKGTKHIAKVLNLVDYGIFVELEEDVIGLVHISKILSYRRINHPAEFTKIGEKINISILEIDKKNRRLSLGYEIKEENGYLFEKVFLVNSIHKGEIIDIKKNGAIIALDYGLTVFAPTRHLIKSDGYYPKAKEILDFKVIELNKKFKRIYISHTSTHRSVPNFLKKAYVKRRIT